MKEEIQKHLLKLKLPIISNDFKENASINYLDQVETSEEGNKEEPEPQEDEDLLIEEVDWQYTLDCVAQHIL